MGRGWGCHEQREVLAVSLGDCALGDFSPAAQRWPWELLVEEKQSRLRVLGGVPLLCTDLET